MPTSKAWVRGLAFLALGSTLGCNSPEPAVSLEQAVEELSVSAFVEHMTTLASDEMAGRGPGTAGYDAAAAYVVREAEALGLEPAGVDGSFLQPILFRRSTTAAATFAVDGAPLQAGTDFLLTPRVLDTETDLRAPMVFVGFGISAPDMGYDDFDGIDVEGKLVVVIPGAPDGFGSLERTVLSSGAARDRELMARGAAGLVLVSPSEPSGRPAPRSRIGFVPPAGAQGTSAPSNRGELQATLAVPRRIAAAWMSRVGQGFDDVYARIQAGQPSSFDLDAEAHIAASFGHDEFESANVVARLPGTDPQLRDEHLVMTAHLDHLGIRATFEGDSIYNGTLDNASGSAALLTLASALSRLDSPRRSMLFLWVTAEESGLLGAEYFARYPTVDGVIANQNIDGVMGMIAAASDMLAFGYEHSNLSEAVDFAVARTGTPVSPDPTPEENLFVRSDQYAFVRNGIPAIWVQSGRTAVDPAVEPQEELDRWIVERYHRPSDDNAQPMDLNGVRVELQANLLVTHHILNEMGAVRWDTSSFLYQRYAR